MSLVKIKRGDEWNEDGGCRSATSCDGSALIRLQVAANDDTTPASELGYLIESTGTRLDVPKAPLLSDSNGQIQILLQRATTMAATTSASSSRSSPSTRQATSPSQPAPLTVTDEGKACQLASNAPTGTLWCTALLLALLVRRRRMQRSEAGTR